MNPEIFMKRALQLAARGLGSTWPNPLVGAVIVKNDKIIGEGFHKKAGLPHAEANALNNCQESVEGSEIYVNLEPCCHLNKRTPPCAQALIKAGIKKVFIANLDPNPEVNGKGVTLLKEHGIDVEVGILKEEGEKLNEVFFHVQKYKRPFIHLKLASSLDGKIALMSGESKWITGDKAREHVHLLRSQHQAIMIGGETLRKDNPKLNVRLPDFSGEQPYRVVISQSKNFSKDLNLFSDELKERTLIYSSIEEAMTDLFSKKIISVFLEGGPTLAAEFLKRKLVDRASFYMNPSLIGEGLPMLNNFSLPSLKNRPTLKNISYEFFEDDLFLTGRIFKDEICLPA